MEEKTCGGESRGIQTGMRQLLRWFGIALIVISMLGPAFAPVSYGVEANSAEDSQVKTVKITTKPASGQINRRMGVVVRKSASSRSKKVARLPNNKKITMEHMTFTTTKNYSRKQRWFHIRCGSVKGYVPVNQVDHVRYQYRQVKAKRNLTYRYGAGYKMRKKGTLKKGTTLSLCLETKAKGSKTLWYRFRYGKKFYFVSSKDLNLTETVRIEPDRDNNSNSTKPSENGNTGTQTDNKGNETKPDTENAVTPPETNPSVNATVLQSNKKPMTAQMPKSTLTAWYNSLLKMANLIEKNNLKYNTSGGGTTYQKGLKAKKVNCATYISWSLQDAGFEPSGFCFYLGYGKIYDQKIPKNYFIKSPNYLVQTNLNMSLSDCVKKGYLKPGDIVGWQSGYHTMVYKHTKNGKYYFFSVGSKSVANKVVHENTYKANYRIGVIIRRIA